MTVQERLSPTFPTKPFIQKCGPVHLTMMPRRLIKKKRSDNAKRDVELVIIRAIPRWTRVLCALSPCFLEWNIANDTLDHTHTHVNRKERCPFKRTLYRAARQSRRFFKIYFTFFFWFNWLIEQCRYRLVDR